MKVVTFRVAVFGMFFVCGAVFFALNLFAQDMSNTTVASPVRIDGGVNNHDIISYDATSRLYQRSETFADERMFGVVELDPVLYMLEGEVPNGAYPVIRSGEAVVNVSTLGGDIVAGDLITTSRIQGYGQRTDRNDVRYVLGFALDSMEVDETIDTLTIEEQEVQFGSVRAALRIGPHVPGDLDEEIETALTASGAIVNTQEGAGAGFDTFKAFRFVLGALVALTAIFIALNRFGRTFTESVVSVGRNPLARTQIRSVLIWNAFLIFVISGVGISIGAAIILMP